MLIILIIVVFWSIRVLIIVFRQNLILIFIRIEIINLSIAYVVVMYKNNYLKFFRFFKYYFIQSLLIYFIIVSLFIFNRSALLLLFLLCKINLFPRHTWINEIFHTLDIKEFFLLRVFAKIPTLLIILTIEKLNFIIILSVLFTFFWTIFSLDKFNHVNILFSFSNLNSSCWIIVICIRPHYIFYIFIFLYTNLIISVIYSNFFRSNKTNSIPIRLLNIARFPLRTIFFLKVVILNLTRVRDLIIIILLLSNSYIIYIYFKYILNYIITITKLPKYYNFSIKRFFFLYCCFSFWYFFII